MLKSNDLTHLKNNNDSNNNNLHYNNVFPESVNDSCNYLLLKKQVLKPFAVLKLLVVFSTHFNNS